MGWIGNIILIAGLYLISPDRAYPFLITAIGEAIWAVESYRARRTDMLFICVVFFILALRNFWRFSC